MDSASTFLLELHWVEPVLSPVAVVTGHEERKIISHYLILFNFLQKNFICRTIQNVFLLLFQFAPEACAFLLK